jgi:hypothetical protein
MVVLFSVFTILFVIYNRIESQRTHTRIFSLTGRRMPALHSTQSRSLFKKTVSAWAQILGNDVVPQPGRGNALDGALLYGTRTNLHKYVVGIGTDLLAFACEAIAAAFGDVGGQPAARPTSLRQASPLLVDAFGLSALDLASVVSLTERASVLGAAADPTPDEFSEFREAVWRIMHSIEDSLRAVSLGNGSDSVAPEDDGGTEEELERDSAGTGRR